MCDDGAERNDTDDDVSKSFDVCILQGHCQGLGLLGGELLLQNVVRNDSSEDDRNDDVNECADDERSNDADRKIAARIAGLFRNRRHGIKTDVRKEHDRCAGLYARPAVRHEWAEVRCPDIIPSDDDEERQYDEFQQHHRCIYRGAFSYANDQHNRNQRDDSEGEDIENDRNTENVGSIFEQSWYARRRAVVG